jgi:predicted CopG family antitoxin
MSRLTISINDEAKKKLHLLAKKRKRTISGIINELIDQESKKIKLKARAKGLGTYLSELPIQEIPAFKNEKEMLGKLKEEKHMREA